MIWLSDEGLTLETSAPESPYGGQFTLSTQLIKPNYIAILPPTQHRSFFRNLSPFLIYTGCLLKIGLGYLNDTKFYLERKASFIHMSNIASFKLCLITWFREYCTFSDSSLVSLKSSSWHPVRNYFCKKTNHVLLPNFFFFFKYVLYLTVLSKYLKKVGGHRARSREKERSIYFAIELNLREISHFLYLHALMCALMTRKSCAIGVRNAILRNYLKLRPCYTQTTCLASKPESIMILRFLGFSGRGLS